MSISTNAFTHLSALDSLYENAPTVIVSSFADILTNVELLRISLFRIRRWFSTCLHPSKLCACQFKPTLKTHFDGLTSCREISGTELSDLEIVTTQTPHWRRMYARYWYHGRRSAYDRHFLCSTLDVSFPSIPTFIRRLKVEKSYKM